MKYAQDQALGPKTVESPKKAKMTDFYQAKKRQPKVRRPNGVLVIGVAGQAAKRQVRFSAFGE